MKDWHQLASMHSLGHSMSGGLFVQGACAYCGLTTIDFCPQCQVFVCRRCDTPRHWPDVGIAVDVGFAPVYANLGRRRPR